MIIDLQKKLKEKMKKTLPPHTFSASSSGTLPDARFMVKEALILAKAGNLSGAVDTAYTAGYVACATEIKKELDKILKEYCPEIWEARQGKKGRSKK
ncbi:MAG: hypothetical protein K6U04_08765 [Armatimonadetes bacterium]|nr:hypothetical protein [Armatimonadota bacterium]